MPRSKSDDTSTAFTAVDLFCGAGGFSLGLERAGFDVRLAVDSWQVAIDIDDALLAEIDAAERALWDALFPGSAVPECGA